MAVLAIVRIINVLSVGLIAGMFLDFFSTTPARAALNPSSFVRYQQVTHEIIGRIAQTLIVVAALSGIVWLIMIWSQWQSAQFWLVALATIGIIAVAVLTAVVNVPINDQLMTWSVDSPPANLREIWATWDRGNRIRTVIAEIAFVCAVVALNL